MGKLFVLMGKSATGKDTVLNKLLESPDVQTEIPLRKIIDYTTRPRREGELDGIHYNFSTEEKLKALKEAGKVIECRCYQTVHGPWYYFNVDDGQFDFENGNRIAVSTLEGYCQIRKYFGEDKVVPLYLEISDRTRIHRAMEREDMQSQPKYAELCRRFLADNEDFSEEHLMEAGITERYSNEDLTECIEMLKRKIVSSFVSF